MGAQQRREASLEMVLLDRPGAGDQEAGRGGGGGEEEEPWSSSFDLGRMWCLDACCLPAARRAMVVVTVVLGSQRSLREFARVMGPRLAVGATASYSSEEARRPALRFAFSRESPLVGPMSYREVESAAEHYLGWCRQAEARPSPWARGLVRLNVCLLPLRARQRPVRFAEQGCMQQALRGVGFPHAGAPCPGPKASC